MDGITNHHRSVRSSKGDHGAHGSRPANLPWPGLSWANKRHTVATIYGGAWILCVAVMEVGAVLYHHMVVSCLFLDWMELVPPSSRQKFRHTLRPLFPPKAKTWTLCLPLRPSASAKQQKAKARSQLNHDHHAADEDEDEVGVGTAPHHRVHNTACRPLQRHYKCIVFASCSDQR